MTLFRKLFAIFSAPASPQPAPKDTPPEPAIPPVSRQRTVSSSLARTENLLRERPDLTANDLAAELALSPSYARRLLRRARATMSAASPAPLVVASTPIRVPDREIDDLRARLEKAETSLAVLCSSPPQSRGTWNLNRRAEVLRLAHKGMQPKEIAADMRIPAGEVEFILKVDRLLHPAR